MAKWFDEPMADDPIMRGTQRCLTKTSFSFISQLSAVPAEGLARIPILVTGSWVKGGREVSFTRDELSTAIENFQKLANHDLNVDYDHACEDLERAAGEPTPSAGRILALDEPEEFDRDRSGHGSGRDSGRATPVRPGSRTIPIPAAPLHSLRPLRAHGPARAR